MKTVTILLAGFFLSIAFAFIPPKYSITATCKAKRNDPDAKQIPVTDI